MTFGMHLPARHRAAAGVDRHADHRARACWWTIRWWPATRSSASSPPAQPPSRGRLARAHAARHRDPVRDHHQRRGLPAAARSSPATRATSCTSLPVVMACALIASRIVSMTFIPLLGYYLLRAPRRRRPSIERAAHARASPAATIASASFAIEHRWLVLRRLPADPAARRASSSTSSRTPSSPTTCSTSPTWTCGRATARRCPAPTPRRRQAEQVIRDVATQYGTATPGADGKPRDVLESISTLRRRRRAALLVLRHARAAAAELRAADRAGARQGGHAAAGGCHAERAVASACPGRDHRRAPAADQPGAVSDRDSHLQRGRRGVRPAAGRHRAPCAQLAQQLKDILRTSPERAARPRRLGRGDAHGAARDRSGSRQPRRASPTRTSPLRRPSRSTAPRSAIAAGGRQADPDHHAHAPGASAPSSPISRNLYVFSTEDTNKIPLAPGGVDRLPDAGGARIRRQDHGRARSPCSPFRGPACCRRRSSSRCARSSQDVREDPAVRLSPVDLGRAGEDHGRLRPAAHRHGHLGGAHLPRAGVPVPARGEAAHRLRRRALRHRRGARRAVLHATPHSASWPSSASSA